MNDDDISEINVRIDALEESVSQLSDMVLKLEKILEDIASYVIPDEDD